MMKLYPALTRCWFSLLAGSLCLTSTAFGESHRNAKSNICNQPIQINPQHDIGLEYADVIAEDLFQILLEPPISQPDLTNIVGQFNSARTPGSIVVNPTNLKNIVINYGSGTTFREIKAPRFFLRLSPLPRIAFSNDGGRTWNQSFAVLPSFVDETSIVVDGLSNINQTTSIQGNLQFSKKGVLFAQGTFNQTHEGDPLLSFGGIYVNRSLNGGATWEQPVVIDVVKSGSFAAVGRDEDPLGLALGFIVNAVEVLPDPIKPNVVHAFWDLIDNTQGTNYGNFWYARSKDEGQTFSTPKLIYDMVEDPTWVAQHGDGFPNLSVTPPIELGGQAVTAGRPVVSVPLLRKNENGKKRRGEVLIAQFLRFYPIPGAKTYTQNVNPTNTIDSFSDHAVIRSFDGGLTWTKDAVVVGGGPFVFAQSHSPLEPTGSSIISFDSALASYLAVSPKTNRVYSVWQGGNTTLSSDPVVQGTLPTIQLSVSDDAGASWSPPIFVNTLPNNSFLLANQDFNPNIAILDDGCVGIIFSTFRNFTGNASSTVAEASNQLAIFRETDDPKGGSTGVGLDFCRLVQLGPTFDGQLGFSFPFGPGFPLPKGIGFSVTQGFGGSNAITSDGRNFLTAFDLTNPNSLPLLPLVPSPVFGVNLDINNRMNVFFDKVCNPNCCIKKTKNHRRHHSGSGSSS